MIKDLTIQFHENHHWTTLVETYYQDGWEITGVWVNNETDESCNENPCQNCKEMSNAGITIQY